MDRVLVGWLELVGVAALAVGLVGLFVGRRNKSSRALVDSLFVAGLSIAILMVGFVLLALAPQAGLNRAASFVVVGAGLIALALVLTLVRIAYILGNKL